MSSHSATRREHGCSPWRQLFFPAPPCCTYLIVDQNPARVATRGWGDTSDVAIRRRVSVQRRMLQESPKFQPQVWDSGKYGPGGTLPLASGQIFLTYQRHTAQSTGEKRKGLLRLLPPSPSFLVLNFLSWTELCIIRWRVAQWMAT